MGPWLWTIILGALQALGFALAGVDKKKARDGAWRIPERTLFLVALLGGSPGLYLGCRVFHHKTKHKRFMVGLPVPMAIQLMLVVLLWRGGFLGG